MRGRIARIGIGATLLIGLASATWAADAESAKPHPPPRPRVAAPT